jgi:SAM-dependent methyltransferase
VETRNSTGRPLASPCWLETHHLAKLPERIAFARKLAQLRPSRIVDLGCGTGLWLDALDSLMPTSCEFIGLDSDPAILARAEERARRWRRRARFEQCDIGSEASGIPAADLTLLFNVVPYLQDPSELFVTLATREPRGTVAIRQYDGGALRFGPMDTEVRARIDASLRNSVVSSEQFRHYDMDRLFPFLYSPSFKNRRVEFELFERTAPYSEQFLEYARATLAWTLDLVSEDAATLLSRWQEAFLTNSSSIGYWFEVDVTAVLS